MILYQRRRFRGGEGSPGTPRFELGIQQKEDALHRLVDVWATGEASASLGFAAARLFDELDPLEKQKDQWLAEKKLTGRAAFKELAEKQQEALELLRITLHPVGERDHETGGGITEVIRWCSSLCSIRWPMSCVRRANSGTPATAQT